MHTLHVGCFTAHETLLQCQQCPNDTIYASEQLSQLAPAGCTFGYDVLNFVGQALFLRSRRVEEIIEELRARHVRLSPSEVDYLGKKFVVYLALAHRQSAPGLQEAMRLQGGYILHLDGTCEGGGPMLMSSLDSLSEIVLGNVKVPSEKTAQIVPFLKEIKSRYGVPVAMVHDMGAGILAAVKEVFAGVADFVCHFHFLRDLGKDLLERDYDAIRQRLRKQGLTDKLRHHARRLKTALDQQPDLIQSFCENVQGNCLPKEKLELLPLLCAYSLIQWALEGKSDGQGYGFPFDRPHVQFAKRLRVLGQRLEQIKHVHLRGQWADNKPLLRLSCELKKVSADEGLEKMLAAIDLKIEVFDRLRSAMRMAQVGGAAGLNSGSNPVAMGPIQKAVGQFRNQITARSDYDSTAHWKAMIDQIDKYQDKLFADPIAVQTPNGRLLLQPQRTNNLMERFFRDWRRGARRRSGHNSISRFLQSMIADTPLVRNLENPRYLKVLLNGQATLEERFGQIDIETVRKELLAAQASLENVPSKIRQLISAPTFLEEVCRLFQKAA
ncbi:MAG: hypothetical protein L0Z50_28250 [Verrucomicrobiales bacterium]|nr:hypothetical protein [Verrucomicrobiales bacterium]